MNAGDLVKASLGRFGLIALRKSHPAAPYLADPPRSALDSILLRVFRELHGLRFLQIGANDGVRADPVRAKVLRHEWTGLLVEPLPPLFAQLQANYSGRPGLDFLNAAVDVTAGTRKLYFIRPGLPGIPDWAGGLGSFDLLRLRQAASELKLDEAAIAEQTVPTVTWDDLRRRFGPRPCDLLVIDTEGYDLTLLRAALLARWRPRVIQFEHACSPADERLAIYGELLALGYEIASDEGDTVAWLRQPAAA
ncbi:MAG TPA: FkbM family methyltransferase [Opitutaceae bacterium]|nr:FkbM family methyltransferase [Opitutaceae bacterium]